MRPTLTTLTVVLMFAAAPAASATVMDIGTEALRRAQEMAPSVDVASYSKRIDALAEAVRRINNGARNADHRIRSLNTVLFQMENFQVNQDLATDRDPEKYFLPHVLDTKVGNCFSLPLLYVAVAQRLEWPVFVVPVPDHMFVRYIDPTLYRSNIEVTSRGRFVPTEQYIRDFHVSAAGLKSGAYMRPLSHQELLGDVVAVTAVALGRKGDLAKAVKGLTEAVRLNPRLAPAWANLGQAYEALARRSHGLEAKKYAGLSAMCHKRSQALGFVHPNDIPPLRNMRRTMK